MDPNLILFVYNPAANPDGQQSLEDFPHGPLTAGLLAGRPAWQLRSLVASPLYRSVTPYLPDPTAPMPPPVLGPDAQQAADAAAEADAARATQEAADQAAAAAIDAKLHTLVAALRPAEAPATETPPAPDPLAEARAALMAAAQALDPAAPPPPSDHPTQRLDALPDAGASVPPGQE